MGKGCRREWGREKERERMEKRRERENLIQ